MIVEYNYEVLMHLLPAVVNDETRHLTNTEFNQLVEFKAEFGDHWVPLYDEEFPDDLVQGMAKCDVTGRIGWCAQIEPN